MITAMFATIFSIYITYKISVALIRLCIRFMSAVSFMAVLGAIFLVAAILGGSPSLLLLALLIFFLTRRSKVRERERETTFSEPQVKTVPYREAREESIPVQPVRDDENGRIISGALQEIYSMNNLVSGLRNETIRNSGFEVCQKARTILNVLRNSPEQIPSVRQFWNYYLPSTSSILKKYEKLERSNVADWEVMKKVGQYLTDVNMALDNLYNSLFDVDKKSLNIEMEALQLAMQREGLVSSDEVIDSSSGIRLAI